MNLSLWVPSANKSQRQMVQYEYSSANKGNKNTITMLLQVLTKDGSVPNRKCDECKSSV